MPQSNRGLGNLSGGAHPDVKGFNMLFTRGGVFYFTPTFQRERRRRNAGRSGMTGDDND